MPSKMTMANTMMEKTQIKATLPSRQEFGIALISVATSPFHLGLPSFVSNSSILFSNSNKILNYLKL